MYILNIITIIIGIFGDNARKRFGRWLVNIIIRYKLADIPTSAVFSPEAELQTIEEMRAAFDQSLPNGQRGGWQAAQSLINKKREQATSLFASPKDLVLTILMGMPGEYTPKTYAAAKALYDDLLEQYNKSGEPGFLYGEVHATVVKLLIEADAKAGVSKGCLQKLFETRINTNREIGERLREQIVLKAMSSNQELTKFMGRDSSGDITLPSGKTYEEFATSMLINAYGKPQ